MQDIRPQKWAFGSQCDLQAVPLCSAPMDIKNNFAVCQTQSRVPVKTIASLLVITFMPVACPHRFFF